jgi:hypothetical protein
VRGRALKCVLQTPIKLPAELNPGQGRRPAPAPWPRALTATGSLGQPITAEPSDGPHAREEPTCQFLHRHLGVLGCGPKL